MQPVREADFEVMLADFLKRRPLALFLDFDGTLTDIVSHPSMVRLGESMREALEGCVAREDTQVTIVSGRGLRDIRKQVPIEDVLFAGNHGLEIEGPGIATYRHPDIGHYTDRASELARKLEQLETPGVWVEAKGASLTLHFREAPLERHEQIASEASRIIRDAGFQARDALCAVEARPPIGWDKGHAVLHVLRERFGPGWSEEVRAIYVGDDETDEDAFHALSGLGATFRVGPADRPTRARRRLAGVEAVETLLRWIASRSPGEPIAAVGARASTARVRG